MKKHIFQLVLTSIFLVSTYVSISQSYEIRTYENDIGYIEVQMRETDGGEALPETTDDINDITFAVCWLSSYNADIEFLCSTQLYNMSDPGGSRLTEGSYHYRYYNASPSNFDCPENWVVDTWVTITAFKVTSGSGTNGTFEIAPQNFGSSTLNWQILENGIPPINQYTPTINGSVSSYTYPTIVYDYVWTGASNTYWDQTGNWLTECGDAVASAPTATDNCLIPVVGTNYPTGFFAVMTSSQPTCGHLRIQSGASMSLEDFDALSTQLTYTVSNNLTVYGTLNVISDAQLSVSGSTYLDAPECLVVQATSSGVGSFIDNGTITYGASGTAKVQTYLSNSGSGLWYIHLVGPTVDEENYTGSGTGSFLEAFNLANGNTYAYKWDETVVNTLGSEPWINLYSLTEEINTGKGIGLATDDNTNHTLEMTGALITGDKSSPSLTFSQNNNELLSNPYPSSIDFDAFYANTGNSGVIQQKNWVWDAAAGTYLARTTTGGVQYIQVGQALFVQTLGAGTVTFKNSNRVHSNEAFRDVIPNVLTVNVVGGQESYRDEMIIMFNEEATSGYDIEIEAMKWNSQYDDATQIRSVAEDNTELSINVLPLESLNNGMTSVPMHFNCGYNTEYTLSFFDMETFESGSEIWLEDKLIGGDWISINDNPDYIFIASPNDSEDRFVLHFFGPTSVDEFGIENTVDIYGFRQYAFVRNNTNEVIKEVRIFTLAGELLRDIETVDNNINKYWVSDKLGYYVVRVITDKNVYTNKVFISK